MTRHSKVFVPVKDEYTRFRLSEYTADGTFYYMCEEKENVYVLTEEELKDLLYQYEMKFKNNDLISPTTFLKSKIKI